ncbi:DUF2690 domain-containing protein [Nocardioides sp.]|uniref:DUF2690 domain-containing protein n=1 Tax=Nocardioides sp. TaxID=35761 RepID=UPI003529A8E4
MTARWRRALGVLVAALLGVGSVVATIGPAEAASCKGSNCTGKDPGVQGCLGGDSTIDSADWATASPPYAEVLLRYNSSCKAMWAKGFSTPWYAYDIKIVKRRASDDALLYNHRITVPRSGSESPHWTKMAGWTSGSKIKACVESPIDAGVWRCTSWFQLA